MQDLRDNKGRFAKGSQINFGRVKTLETKLKISLSKKGKTSHRKGKKLSDSVKRKMSSSAYKRFSIKENHPRWKGGVTSLSKIIRGSKEYKLWRKSVFERDNYTCIWCGTKGAVLNADHIKPFAYFPELRFAIDNGRTLCVPCHKTTDSYMGKARKNYEKI